MTSSANLSVVVVSLLGGEALESCLRRLQPVNGECIVVLPDAGQPSTTWRKRHPGIHFITSAQTPVPLRRRDGVMAAQKKIVALLEDTSLPVPGWCEAVCDAFEDPMVGAVGGPIDISPSLPARFKALGCSEFGRYHPRRYMKLALGPPGRGGAIPVSRLPGNNLAYRRSLLLDVMRNQGEGIIETRVNEAILARGLRLVLHPNMSAVYAGADHQGARLLSRLRHGRLFAGGRVMHEGSKTRLIWFLISLALPIVLSARALSTVPSAVGMTAFPLVALWVCLMETCWSVGESIGYLADEGQSMKNWH